MPENKSLFDRDSIILFSLSDNSSQIDQISIPIKPDK
jgi:hypothetical protein